MEIAEFRRELVLDAAITEELWKARVAARICGSANDLLDMWEASRSAARLDAAEERALYARLKAKYEPTPSENEVRP